jgi:catechol 2,3-dioxygenase-like lactoylglutathione lyase family enzyme
MGGRATTPPEVTINQITWQVGSLRQVVNGTEWFKEQRQRIIRAGRDMPGSNWHVYLLDFDGHVNELYYGIEQIGWSGHAKPKLMQARGFHETPELPQVSEQQEVDAAFAKGVSVDDGFRYVDTYAETFDVDGVLLPRPFKVTGIGPVRLFTPDVDSLVEYYEAILGLKVTEEIVYDGHRAVFLRANTEHHSMAIYDIALREKLGLRPDTTLMSVGMRVANYHQLKEAAAFLPKAGVELVDLPGELFPGISHAVHIKDPDGHVIQLYFGMEQIGWDGVANTAGRNVAVTSDPALWPDSIVADTSSYNGEIFMGPWG